MATSLPTHSRNGSLTMPTMTVSHATHSLATFAAEHGERHEGLNPAAVGAGCLLALLLLLWITTRFNRDR